VQTDNRANLGVAPEKLTVGEWHFDKDGTPVAGPNPDVSDSGRTALPTDGSPVHSKGQQAPERKGATGDW
jgi:hypothetical protein